MWFPSQGVPPPPFFFVISGVFVSLGIGDVSLLAAICAPAVVARGWHVRNHCVFRVTVASLVLLQSSQAHLPNKIKMVCAAIQSLLRRENT